MRAGHDTSVARSVMVGTRLVREMRRREMVAVRSWSFGTDAVGREEANSSAPPSLCAASHAPAAYLPSRSAPRVYHDRPSRLRAPRFRLSATTVRSGSSEPISPSFGRVTPTAGGAARHTFRNGLAPHDPGVVCGLMLSVLRWQRPTERCREEVLSTCRRASRQGPSHTRQHAS